MVLVVANVDAASVAPTSIALWAARALGDMGRDSARRTHAALCAAANAVVVRVRSRGERNDHATWHDIPAGRLLTRLCERINIVIAISALPVGVKSGSRDTCKCGAGARACACTGASTSPRFEAHVCSIRASIRARAHARTRARAQARARVRDDATAVVESTAWCGCVAARTAVECGENGRGTTAPWRRNRPRAVRLGEALEHLKAQALVVELGRRRRLRGLEHGDARTYARK
jgi:hypothetical protein